MKKLDEFVESLNEPGTRNSVSDDRIVDKPVGNEVELVDEVVDVGYVDDDPAIFDQEVARRHAKKTGLKDKDEAIREMCKIANEAGFLFTVGSEALVVALNTQLNRK